MATPVPNDSTLSILLVQSISSVYPAIAPPFVQYFSYQMRWVWDCGQLWTAPVMIQQVWVVLTLDERSPRK